ncbi:multidrug efflux system subunit MdtC [Salmonella enterica subsp. enterica serovar Kentucky str. 29439]|nr:multidrug efflux system subunit MdtC [Salmonella enterica subsp. enterica serovar Kentucky str. 29439]
MGAENRKALSALPQLADVNSDQQDNGAEMNLIYDRDTMSRLGIDVQAANSLLNNAFRPAANFHHLSADEPV